MDTFERDLVNKLLDKYESSKLSKGGTKVSRNITLTPKDKVLSSYNSIDAHKYITNNDYVIKNLTKKGFIDSKYDNETFISLTLNIDNIESLYKYIGRENPKLLKYFSNSSIREYSQGSPPTKLISSTLAFFNSIAIFFKVSRSLSLFICVLLVA